ncbi:MAG: membrane-bound lytic murein transglycosylase MltF [Desulfobacterales bacterium]|jgi:membrane-bound lytic murein transglycosylase F
MASTVGKIIFGRILTGLLLLAVTSCDKPIFRNDLDVIKEKGVLRVITRNNGACFYEGPHGYEGFEYDLVQAFADHLGLKLELVIIDNESLMVTKLLDGNADLIAANFIFTDDLRQHLAFGPVYQKMNMLVVGAPGGPAPRKAADLIGQPIWVVAGAYHEKCLNMLKNEYPELSWLAISDYEVEELLEMVWKGIIPLTIADSHTLAINRKYYPELTSHFSIDKGQNLAWVMDPKNLHLREAVDQWFIEPSTVLLLQRLNQHYYGHLENFDYLDVKIFRQRLRQRLPRYREYFETAAVENGLDWKLIAAQAYQESHWDPRAKSFTGVRGLMMLTRETARDMGVKNRLDPAESIIGGTRYLATLHSRLDDRVPEPDRIFMALAAYNVGWGHLEDARKLAAQFGKDPNAWSDVRSTLPLLRLKKYYKKLPHGYARGAEPVQYVDRIRTYHEVLDRSERNFRNR